MKKAQAELFTRELADHGIVIYLSLLQPLPRLTGALSSVEELTSAEARNARRAGLSGHLAQERMERVIGIEPTTFSLGSASDGPGAGEGDCGRTRSSQDNSTTCDHQDEPTCDEDRDT